MFQQSLGGEGDKRQMIACSKWGSTTRHWTEWCDSNNEWLAVIHQLLNVFVQISKYICQRCKMYLFNNEWFDNKWRAITPIAENICSNTKIYLTKMKNIFVPIIEYICSTRRVIRERMTGGYTQCTLTHSLTPLLSSTYKCSKSSANVCKCWILFVQMGKYPQTPLERPWHNLSWFTISFVIHNSHYIVHRKDFEWKIVNEEIINCECSSAGLRELRGFLAACLIQNHFLIQRMLRFSRHSRERP